MQVKLLRVLQTGEIQRIGARKAIQTNTRVIAATHINLADAVSWTQFRPNLFYRLNVLPINKTHHNMAASAKRLRISRASLYRKVKEYLNASRGQILQFPFHKLPRFNAWRCCCPC
jgi:transcriptional regulator with PAS, ATPase and Fis domain